MLVKKLDVKSFQSDHHVYYGLSNSTLFPTSCSQKIYDLFLSFSSNFGFSNLWHFADYTTSIGLWIPYQIQNLASHALFQSMAKLSISSTFYCQKSLSEVSCWTGAMG